MDSIEQEVGYLKAKVEEIQSDSIRMEQKLDNLSELVAKKFTTAETMFTVVKFLGLAAVALITFKFGDIKELWGYLFGK